MTKDTHSQKISSPPVPAKKRVAYVKKELQELADQKYAAFSGSLQPGTTDIIGVRLPALRRIARREAKNGWKEFLAASDESSFEMRMIQGLIIGYASGTPTEIIEELTRFVPKITTWSICDSGIASLKLIRKYPEPFFIYASECMKSNQEYTVRFGIVLLSMHLINDDYYQKIMNLLNRPSFPGYYAWMAAAWAVSELFTKYPSETENWLKSCNLDRITFNKAIQKIQESRRIDDETKKRLMMLKR